VCLLTVSGLQEGPEPARPWQQGEELPELEQEPPQSVSA